MLRGLLDEIEFNKCLLKGIIEKIVTNQERKYTTELHHLLEKYNNAKNERI
jgi:hypothetical protein